MEKLPIPQAMIWKFGPQAKCSKNKDGDGIDVWEHPTIPKPNMIQIINILEEYQAHEASVLYQKKRAAEYPTINEQLDAIWKILNDPTNPPSDAVEVKENIEAVKEKYPKPQLDVIWKE